MSSYVTWTAPAQGVHPRIWTTPAGLAALQARAAGTHISHWGSLQRHCDRVKLEAGFPDSFFDAEEPEASACLAFSFLLDASKLEHAARAAAIGYHLANLPFTGGKPGRNRLMAMALHYDWLYPYLASAQKVAIRRRIADYVADFYAADPTERLWGDSLARSGAAMLALLAILGDGSSEENSEWAGWMDALFDSFDLGGSDNTTFLSALRAFGNTDGGTFRGSGPHGYDTELEEVFGRLLPALASGVGVTWDATEAWWDKLATWKLWHWRGDRSFHRSGEQEGLSQYSEKSQLHLLQVAGRQNNTLGKNSQWLVDEIQAVGNRAMTGQHQVWSLLWRETTRPAERPAVSTTGGGAQLKAFSEAGKVVIREDWDPLGASLTIEAPKYFTGGHTRRRAGNFNLAVRGLPILYEKGGLDTGQVQTFKDPADAAETGHRYTYAQRLPAANVFRIFDTDEPAEDLADSFERLPYPDSVYGVLQGDGSIAVSNDGGQLAPKGATGKHQPGNLAELLAESKWDFSSWLITPEDTSKFSHAAFDLKPFYYSAKCTTRYRRHFLWVKPGAIPGWRRPVLIIFDDLSTHQDAAKGKLTQVLQLQAAAAPTGTAAALQFDRGAARCFVSTLKPSSIEKTVVTDYQIEGVSFPATNPGPADDPAGVRVELNIATSAGAQEWLQVLFPVPSSVSAPPSITIIDDGTFIGATIAGIACKVRKASPYDASVASSSDATAPSAPTGLTATAKTSWVLLDWSDSGAGDLEFYRVYRAVGAGSYSLLADQVPASTYRDGTAVNGTAYNYKVTAVDTSGNESSQSSSAGATPAIGIAGPALRRGDGNRRGRRIVRRRRMALRAPFRD